MKNTTNTGIQSRGYLGQRRYILLILYGITLLAVPFVDLIIWTLIYVFGIELNDFNIFVLIGPITTVITVLVLIGPTAYVVHHLFNELNSQTEMAKEAQAKAERLLVQRTDFIAYVSHEIRNPLNGIIGIADNLSSEGLDYHTQEKVNIIGNSAQDLMVILNDILDISKIDEGEVRLDLQPVNLQDLIGRVLNFWEPRAKDSNLKLKVNLDTNIPKYVRLDAYRFRQILNNLLSNAIKYTERGQIFVDMEYDKANELMTIFVTDTGVGIPPTEKDSVFRAYTQIADIEGQGHKRKLGTGLGLPIARRLARMMGGDVELVSSDSAGSKFSFSFAIDALEDSEFEQDELNANVDMSHIKALVVDDMMAGAIVAREHLKKMGIQADISNSGEDALQKQSATKYDLVLVDDDLGTMRGHQIVEAFGYTPTIGFVVYTGQVGDEARKNFARKGFDGYISKPALLADFKRELTRLSQSK